MTDFARMDAWNEASVQLQELLLRYTDAIGSQIDAFHNGDMQRANRLASTGDALLAQCGRVAERLTAARQYPTPLTPEQRARCRSLRTISSNAQATARRLGLLLSAQRSRLLDEIRLIESSDPGPGTTQRPASPKLINIKT